METHVDATLLRNVAVAIGTQYKEETQLNLAERLATPHRHECFCNQSPLNAKANDGLGTKDEKMTGENREGGKGRNGKEKRKKRSRGRRQRQSEKQGERHHPPVCAPVAVVIAQPR